MTGRHRLDTPAARRKAAQRKAGAPLGYSSEYAARAGQVARAESAAILRALVDKHGLEIPLRWCGDELRAQASVPGSPEVNLSRTRVRYWESLGWARLIALAKGKARLDVDPDALPDPPE